MLFTKRDGDLDVMFEVKLKAPLNVEWELTNACNLRCRHCYVRAETRLQKELTTQEALNLIDELDQIGVSDITLSGGEPFLREDIWQIIQEIRTREIPFILYTNGTLLNKQKIRKLVEMEVNAISISLNGARAVTHNFVDDAPTFKKVLQIIQMLKNENIQVQVLYTLMKINANEVDALFLLCEKIGVNAVCFYPFYPTGRGSEHLRYLEPDARIISDILTKIVKKKDESSVKGYVGGCLRRYFSLAMGNLSIKGAPCAKLTAIITADGHLRPCNFLPFRTKDGIRKKKITDLWKDPVFEKIRDWNKRVKVDCSNCERLPICFGCCLSMHLDRLDVDFRTQLKNLCG